MVLGDTERDEITNEANAAVKHRCPKSEVVKRIAGRMSLSEATIYDYLAGRIKMNLRLLKAVVAVTEDPFLMKYLEPEGMSLVVREVVFSPTIAAEATSVLWLGDDIDEWAIELRGLGTAEPEE